MNNDSPMLPEFPKPSLSPARQARMDATSQAVAKLRSEKPSPRTLAFLDLVEKGVRRNLLQEDLDEEPTGPLSD